MPLSGRAVVWFAVYFLAALLPRLSPLLAGTAFADDLIHRPEGHLLSYRFLNYFELMLWQWLFGPDYLLSAAPKIIGALYTATLCSVLRATLASWSAAPRWTIHAIVLLVPLHPLWNTFLCWHVTAVYVLSLALIVAGYAALERHPPFGILLMALGISGYQVHLGLLAPLLFAEIASKRDLPVLRRLLQCGAAIALYLGAVAIAAAAGIHAWGGRGVGLRTTLKPAINNLAVITQPVLSFYGGIDVSWRFWIVPFVVLAFLAMTARPRRFALAPLLLPVAAASVVLLTNAPTTGPRVTAAIWIATLIAAMHSRAATIALIVFTALAIPVTLTDAANRTRAWRADRAILERLPPGAPVAIVRSAETPPLPPEWRSRPIVMQDFSVVTSFDYSNVHVQPEWFFTRFGHRVVVPRPGIATIDATTLRWQQP